MLKIKTLFIFLSILSVSYSQDLSYDIIEQAFPQQKYYGKTKFLDHLKLDEENLTNVLCDGKPCKKNKKADKISFTINNQNLYTKGQWKYDKYSKTFSILPFSDINHQSNDAIYKKLSEEDLYYDNGNLLLKVNNINNTSILYKSAHYTTYLEDGSIDDVVFYRQKMYGVKYEKFFQNPYKPLVSTLNDNSTYEGTRYVGTYKDAENNESTGFFLSLIRERGNGSVFFVENKGNNTYNWVIVVDNKVANVYPAKSSEKPDIESFYTDFEYEGYVGAGLEDNFLLGDVTPKNTFTDGYGFKTQSNYEGDSNNTIDVTVGQFKEGKLNGVGFRNHKVHLSGKVTFKMEYGMFLNGKLIDGETIHIDEPKLHSKDFWSPITYENFQYKAYHQELPFPYSNNAEPYTLKDIKQGDEIMVQSLKRAFDVESINLDNNTIRVKGDYENTFEDISVVDEVIVKLRRDVYGTPSCKTCYGSGKRYIPIYGTQTRAHNHKTGEMTIITNDGSVGRGTIEYNVTYDVRVKTGEQEIVCPACNGSGSSGVPSQKLYLVNVVAE